MKLYVDEWWVINEMTWNLNDRWFCVLGMAVEGINVFWNGLIVPGRKKDQGRQVVQKIWIHACPCSNHQGLDWRSVWTIVGIKLSLGRLGGVLVVVRWIILKQKDPNSYYFQCIKLALCHRVKAVDVSPFCWNFIHSLASNIIDVNLHWQQNLLIKSLQIQ